MPVLDTGARGSTITFVQRGIGDVLIAWENEAFLAIEEFGKDKFEIVAPSLSILAEPPVAVVDGNVDEQGHAQAGRGVSAVPVHAAAQAIIAPNYFRPRDPERRAGDLEAVSQAGARHGRRRVRGLDEGAGDAFRRRRRVRSDPEGEPVDDGRLPLPMHLFFFKITAKHYEIFLIGGRFVWTETQVVRRCIFIAAILN